MSDKSSWRGNLTLRMIFAFFLIICRQKSETLQARLTGCHDANKIEPCARQGTPANEKCEIAYDERQS